MSAWVVVLVALAAALVTAGGRDSELMTQNMPPTITTATTLNVAARSTLRRVSCSSPPKLIVPGPRACAGECSWWWCRSFVAVCGAPRPLVQRTRIGDGRRPGWVTALDSDRLLPPFRAGCALGGFVPRRGSLVVGQSRMKYAVSWEWSALVVVTRKQPVTPLAVFHLSVNCPLRVS